MANDAFSLKSASVRWAGWATVTYGRVGKHKTRVGKRIFFSALRFAPNFAHPGLKPCRRPCVIQFRSNHSRPSHTGCCDFCHIHSNFAIVCPMLCNAWTEYKFTCVCVGVCVCVRVRHTLCQLAYRSDRSIDFYD